MTILTEKIEKDMVSVTIKGHAGYRAKEDPVCAAASILMCAMIENFKESGQWRTEEIPEPIAEIRFQKTEENLMKYDAIRKGFEILEEEYPKNVKVGAKCF